MSHHYITFKNEKKDFQFHRCPFSKVLSVTIHRGTLNLFLSCCKMFLNRGILKL